MSCFTVKQSDNNNIVGEFNTFEEALECLQSWELVDNLVDDVFNVKYIIDYN